MLSNSSVIWFGAGMVVATLYWLIMEVVPGVEYRRLRDAASAEDFTSAELKPLRSVGWTFSGYELDPAIVFEPTTRYTRHEREAVWAESLSRCRAGGQGFVQALVRPGRRSD